MAGRIEKGIRRVESVNIPNDLQSLKQWVAWKAVPGGNGKFTKVPVDPKTGNNAATNNPDTWGTYEEAIEHYNWNKGIGIDGIGFVFTKVTRSVVSTWMTAEIQIPVDLKIGLSTY